MWYRTPKMTLNMDNVVSFRRESKSIYFEFIGGSSASDYFDSELEAKRAEVKLNIILESTFIDFEK